MDVKMREGSSGQSDSRLIDGLKEVLLDLHRHPYPLVASPPDLKKRASVAIIIRINPTYKHWPKITSPHDYVPGSAKHDADNERRLDRFFDQQWVDEGEAEVLFIKRASRKGDRWTGHVALPGGGRDPEDEDDRATAVRETWEEVGIDLTGDNSIPVGNLPQRLVTSSWGKVPLMVLCPYVFLLVRHDFPPPRLQPTEVASAHWVPLRALLSPSVRTWEYQDLSARFAKQEYGLKRLFYSLLFGHMMFSAIQLVPSETLYQSHYRNFLSIDQSDDAPRPGIFSSLLAWKHLPAAAAPPLLMWGLTLGIMGDFLELLPPHNALQLWWYPTFSALDLRFFIWAMSYRFRKGKYRNLDSVHSESPASIEIGLDSMPMPSKAEVLDEKSEDQVPETGVSGIGTSGYYDDGPDRKWRGSRSSRVVYMLEGYYDIIKAGVRCTLVTRGIFVVATGFMLWRRYR